MSQTLNAALAVIGIDISKNSFHLLALMLAAIVLRHSIAVRCGHVLDLACRDLGEPLTFSSRD